MELLIPSKDYFFKKRRYLVDSQVYHRESSIKTKDYFFKDRRYMLETSMFYKNRNHFLLKAS